MNEVCGDEGYRFMGAAFEVYNDRGYGLLEELYQECLEIELELRGMPFAAKQELKCFYKGRELRKRYLPDLVVMGKLIVELKAVNFPPLLWRGGPGRGGLGPGQSNVVGGI